MKKKQMKMGKKVKKELKTGKKELNKKRDVAK